MYLLSMPFANFIQLIAQEEFSQAIIELLQDYERLGPIPGIMLPFIEAFFPFLPLIVFVLANGAAYGLFKGFLYSWIGASLGSIVVFLIIRRLGNKRIFQVIRNNQQVQRVTDWLSKHGFGPLFILLCFPFSPSSVINVVAGLSKVSTQQFILAVLLGKSVMIFSIAYVGSSLIEFAKNPLKAFIVGISIILFWLFGKFIEAKLQQKTVEHKHQS